MHHAIRRSLAIIALATPIAASAQAGQKPVDPQVRSGILFYVDGTQSVGALRMDVSAFEPSMMAVDAYKWMLTPNGAGFAYVHPRVCQWLPPSVIGWRSHHEWRSVDSLHTGAPEFSIFTTSSASSDGPVIWLRWSWAHSGTVMRQSVVVAVDAGRYVGSLPSCDCSSTRARLDSSACCRGV